MKLFRWSLILVAAVSIVVGLGGASYAFHDGGVARCEGCHTMHYSRVGNPLGSSYIMGTPNAQLLIGSDSSSTCMNCHIGTGSYHMVSSAYTDGVGPANFTPGGDFVWLKKDYTWTTPRSGSSKGERHGHNVVAVDRGYTTDTTITQAPGGIFPASSLSCISCHDPHGKWRRTTTGFTTTSIGNQVDPIGQQGSYCAAPVAGEAVGIYRILRVLDGANPQPVVACVPSSYNRKEWDAATVAESDTRVAYGKNTSEFCAGCHSTFHSADSATDFKHPASNAAVFNTLNPNIVTNYNAYVYTGNLTGTQANAFTSLISYEHGTDDLVVLSSFAGVNTNNNGPSGTENLMCLTCHRAHASGWDSIGRWNFRTDFIVHNGTYVDPDMNWQGRTQTEAENAYNGRLASMWSPFQRSLCNKCHVQD